MTPLHAPRQNRLVVFIATIYFVVCLALVALTGIQSQMLVGEKLPGFISFDNGMVLGTVDQKWTGTRHGLKRFDYILSYNGQSYQNHRQFLIDLQELPAHTDITYKVQRDDDILELKIPPMNVDQDFVNVYLLPLVFAGLFTILAGTILFFAKPNARGSFLFFAVCNTLGVFVGCTADIFSCQTFLLPLYISIALYAMINLHGIVYLVRHRRGTQEQNKQLFHAIFTGLYVMSIVVTLSLYQNTQVKSEYFVNMVFITDWIFVLSGVFVYASAITLYFVTASQITKQQLMIFLSLSLSCAGAFAIFASQTVFHVLLPVELSLMQIGFPAIVTYVLFRHNFLNFNLYPKRHILYLFIAVFISCLFVFDFLFLEPLLRKYEVRQSFIQPILIASICLKIFFMVWLAYTRTIDRVFFPSTYKFRSLIRKTSTRILQNLKASAITGSVIDLLKEELEIQKIYLFLKQGSDQKLFLQKKFHDQNKDTFSKLPQFLNDQELNEFNQAVISPEDISRSGKCPSLLQAFKQDSFALALPLRFRNNLIGIILLGQKPNRLPYSTEDLSNLNAILAACAVGLMHAEHYQTLESLHEQLERENKILKGEIKHKLKPHVIGEKTGLKSIFERLDKLTDNSISILLKGETGTGKEVLARTIHERSNRAGGPLVKINCAAIPENLIESELFGHEKGAFTGATEKKPGLFELAQNGTLFLDEIGEVPLPVQAKLLRALQEKEIQRVGGNKWIPIDVRIIAATNRDLEKAVQAKKFRADLFYRLNVMPLQIPPLRDRKEDIEDLVSFFITKATQDMNKQVLAPTRQALEKLKNYNWPGNVRELQNVVERSVALTENGQAISFYNLDQTTDPRIDITGLNWQELLDNKPMQVQMEEFKKTIIKRAIKKADGNKSQAARDLGIHAVSLHKMIKQLGLDS